MISKNHIFKVLLVFILGIFLAKYLRIDWILAFTIWSFTLISLLLLVFFGRDKFHFRKLIGLNLLLVFLGSGILGGSSSLTKNIDNHFYKHFLPKDQLIGDIVELEAGDGKYNKVIIQVEHVVNEYREKSVEGKLLCYIDKNASNISLGNKLIISPRIFPIKNKNNPGEFDAENYWETQGITELSFLNEDVVQLVKSAGFYGVFWNDWREYFKNVIRKYVSDENFDVVSALVLGDKSSLSKEKRAVFANSGAMHVLAVSGMHVGILLGFLQFIFYRISFLRKRNLYIYFALFVVWCFAFLTGLSASVFRAAIMFTILGIGQLRGYSFFSLNAVLFSGFVLLIIDANYLFNIGFQLSFLAMLGIIFFYKRIRNLLNIKNRWINYFWEGTSIGIAAQIGTLPISLYYFHQFPNYFIITNIGLLILAGAALISAIMLFILHTIPFVNEVLGKIVDFVFNALTGFVTWINELPFTVSTGFNPSWLHVLLMYSAIVAILYFASKRLLAGFRFASLVLFMLSLGLIVEREMNKQTRELVVFNNYNKTIAVKTKNKIYCFFSEDKDSQLDKTEFLVSGYGKQMGCDILYTPVKVNNKVLLGNDFNLVTNKKGWNITYFKHEIYLVDKIDPQRKPSSLLIGGSWNKYIPQEYVDIKAFRSAFTLKP